MKKADLVEQLAGLIETKKAPLLGDVRDESAEDVRLVLEPRARTVEPDVLMESLFKLSDLETRFPVNMNVLDAHGAPRVMGLKTALRAFLDHRREVLVRRARFRLAKIETRLHILDGLLIVFLNLDEVIRIVRFEDEPKARLIETFALTDIQADAILNTRLRQLARLEEMELRREHADLAEERDGIQSLLASEKEQWKLVGVGSARRAQGAGRRTPRSAARRSTFEAAPTIDASTALEALVAREPITVILSERGWIRAARGRVEDPSDAEVQGGRQARVPGRRRDHRQAADIRVRRPLLHPGLRQAAVRAGARRAIAADGRSRGPGRDPRRVRPSSPDAGASWRPTPDTASSFPRTRRSLSARPANRC